MVSSGGDNGFNAMSEVKADPPETSRGLRSAVRPVAGRLRFVFCLLVPAAASAAAPVDFVRDVRPILEKRCHGCHGEKKQKSGLRLDIKSEALKGGDNHGPDIIPGNAGDSPLIHFITAGEDGDKLMPPSGSLTPAEITVLTSWIDGGAVWPDGVDTAAVADRRDHWSFQPPVAADPDAGAPGSNPIDAFIQARLREHGLPQSPPADAVSWIRRVTLDLTGLPPTPEEITVFLTEKSEAAAVDRLLASPRYGERQAQHWLDVVRYADTHGFEVNTERPNAWPYRDYVIDAFNNDVPYDQFIKEQLAGDALGRDAATGFLVTASVLLPGQIGADEQSKRLARQDAIDEMVVNIGQTFLGLSIGCARCHDHKFDPVTARDYYSMQAFVAGVEYGDRDLRPEEAAAAREEAARLKPRLARIDADLGALAPLAGSGAARPMVNPRLNTDRFAPVNAKRLRFTITASNNLEPCVDELEIFNTDGVNIALATAGTGCKSDGDTTVAGRHELRFLNDGRYGNPRSWMSDAVGKGRVELEFAAEQTIDRVVWGRDREGEFTDRLAVDYQIETCDAAGHWQTVASAGDRRPFDPNHKTPERPSLLGLTGEDAGRAMPLIDERAGIEARIAAAANQPQVFAGSFRVPDDIRLLNRGDPEQPKEPVAPAVPDALGDLHLPRDAPERGRRLALADWIADPANPLTARVMVNRIWQGHFGAGIVSTPSDFGHMGTKPTHPELLDWLSLEFIRGGWSVKRMHRLILLSAAYRQSARSDPAGEGKDADARYLWRFPNRRLEAESIRDSMLAVSGRLNPAMHGSGFNLFSQRGGLSGFDPVESFGPENERRMIYAHKVRREPEAVFGAFDCPDAGQSTAVRRASTTPVQALNLFNSRFTLVQAEAFAARVRAEAGDDVREQIIRAWRLALGREPSPAELTDTEPVIRGDGLPALCRALFNSNEFLFLP